MAEKGTRAYRAQSWFAVLLFAGIIGFVAWEVTKAQQSDPPPDPTDTAATRLYTFDGAHAGAGDKSLYGTELVLVERKCANPVDDITRFIENSYTDLRNHGVKDETALTLLRHLDQSVPDGSKMDCQGVLAAYLVLRES